MNKHRKGINKHRNTYWKKGGDILWKIFWQITMILNGESAEEHSKYIESTEEH